ncbi:COP9 signalosome complex subunit 3 [Naviculisporaceae sp. PSN 640]
MDHCASVLLAFPPTDPPKDNIQYDQLARSHYHKVERLIKENVNNFSTFAQQLLDVVNPATHSISYLALLSVLIKRENASQKWLLESVTRFLLTFDARQVRYAGIALSNILGVIEEGWLFPNSVTVELLATALLRVDPTGSVLTSHHLPLVTLAYNTDNIDPVLPLIEKTTVFYPGIKSTESRPLSDTKLPPSAYVTTGTGLTEKVNNTTVLKYDLLVGMCFMQKKMWQQAFEALERVVTYPTKDNGCSKIMVEAHNKWLLVGLLLTGKTPQLPATTSQGVQKSYTTLGKPYASICEAFEKDTADFLKSELENLGNQFWVQDRNLGLIRSVIAHYQRWQIINLREVYTKISLEQIRRCTQSAETGGPLGSDAEVETLIQGMIDEGILRGVIEKPLEDDKPAHLVFLEPTEDLSEAEFAKKLLTTANRIKDLAPIIQATNERLTTTPDYLRFVIREQAKAAGGQKGGVNNSFDLQVEDEDLMTGIIRS